MICAIPGGIVGYFILFSKFLMVPNSKILLQYFHECGLLHPLDGELRGCGILPLPTCPLENGIPIRDYIFQTTGGTGPANIWN